MGKQSRFTRKHFLIARKFQLKYALLIVAFMFFIATFTSASVYYTSLTIMGDKLEAVYPQGRLVAIINEVNMQLIKQMLLFVPIVTMLAVLLSHKVAGPVYRMEQYLGEVAKGDFSSLLKLRRGDELKNLAEAINRMTKGLGDVARDNQSLAIQLRDMVLSLDNEIKKSTPNTGKVKALASEASEKASILYDRMLRYKAGGRA